MGTEKTYQQVMTYCSNDVLREKSNEHGINQIKK